MSEHSLRLFSAPATAPTEKTGFRRDRGLSPGMRLSEFFQRFYVPVRLVGEHANAKTIVSYLESIKHWMAITGDPPLNQIDDYTLAEFTAGLAELPGRKGRTLSSYTRRKHVQQLNAVFLYTGPRDPRRCKQAQALLDEPPYMTMPRREKQPPKGNFTIDEINRILEACEAMTAPDGWPRDIAIAAWWRALVTVLYYTGLRIGSVMRAEFAHINGEWLDVPSSNAKRHNGERKYLDTPARLAIESITTDRRLIFPWPCCKRWMWAHWLKLLELSGIPASRRFGYHGLRRAHVSELCTVDAAAAQISANHSEWATTKQHYVNPNVAKAGIQKLPRLKIQPSEQLRLF